AKKGDPTAQASAKKASKERLKLGIEEFERRVKDRPTELVLRYQLGSQLYKAKQFDDAIGHLQKATGDPRKGINARVLLGKCFASKGMHDLAVKELSKARDSASGDASKEITYNLAIVLEKAGKNEAAVTEYEKVIEADYNYKDARKRLEALSA
ncbi:MAG: tetratricopeptide repeat protein, partial [Planctomycetota bacterium]